MPYLVHWTANALAGLVRCHAFLAETDAAAARRPVETITTTTEVPERFPEAGRPADGLGPGRRELLTPFGVTGYAAIYVLHGDTVLILAFKHQREAGYLD